MTMIAFLGLLSVDSGVVSARVGNAFDGIITCLDEFLDVSSRNSISLDSQHCFWRATHLETGYGEWPNHATVFLFHQL